MLYEKIKELAASKGLTIAEIEKQTDLSIGSINKWRFSVPAANSLYGVAKILGTTVEDLLKEGEEGA